MTQPMPLATPASVRDERYVLLDRLGEGGMASVWRARDTALGVERAIKLLQPDPQGRASLRRRLRAEARAMARINHPNVLRILDIGAEGELDWVVTELAPGGSLQDRADREGALPPAAAIEYLIQVLSALAAAHAAGIVHRDVKPANILLDAEGRALLADFGIALLADDEEMDRRTKVGIAMGSMAFMPPEQRVDARSVGPAADVYAAGTTLYYLLSAANPVDLYSAPADSPRWSGIHPEIVEVLQRATALHPEQRWPDAAAMAWALHDLLGRLSPEALSVTHHTAVPAHTPRPASSRVVGPTVHAATRTAMAELSAVPNRVPADHLLIDEALRQIDEEDQVQAHTRLEHLSPSPARRVWPAALGASALALIAIWAVLPLLSGGPQTAQTLQTLQTPTAVVPPPALVQPTEPAPAPPPAPELAAPEAPESEPPVTAPKATPPPPAAAAKAKKANALLPAPLGDWSGAAGGIVVSLTLSGEPGALRGRWTSRFGGQSQTTELAGAYDPPSRTLRLADTHEGPDAGTYTLALSPDESRLEGKFERTAGGVRTLSLRRR